MLTDSAIPAPGNSPVTSNVIKLVAIITMLIDHIGYVLFPQYRLLRYIGRIAFPLFIFLLVEGFFHTHDRRLYLLRLCGFAAVSEVCFDLAFHRMLLYKDKCNVFFTLAIGFAVMCLMEYMFTADRRTFRFPAMIYGAMLGVISCIILADLLHTDYGSHGVVAIGVCCLGRHFRLNRMLCFAGACAILMMLNSWEIWSFCGLPLIYLYNGRLGQKNPAFQYACYLFYPVHLLLLYALYMLIRA